MPEAPEVPWLEGIALIVVLAHFGRPGEIWTMGGSPGVLELDLRRSVASMSNRRPSWQADIERVVLPAAGNG